MRNIVSLCLGVVSFLMEILLIIGSLALTILGAVLAYDAIAQGVWPLAFPIAGVVAMVWCLVLDEIREGI